MIEEQTYQLVTAVFASDNELAEVIGDDLPWLAHASDDELQHLLEGLAERLDTTGEWQERRLATVLRRLVERAYSGGHRAWKRLTVGSRTAVVRLYQKLGPTSSVRHTLLQLLAVSHGPEDLAAFAELVVLDPPADTTAAAVACGPLFQQRDYDVAPLFPRLLDALSHGALAPLIMDLANYLTREKIVDVHPAAARRQQLAELLGAVTQRLGLIEEQPESVAADERQLSAMVSDGVSLAISLCDALGLIGDASSIGKLNQVLELRHRRLRTEAAAALARLGDENGQQVLLSLAAEPVARLRVLAYAAELGLEDQIDERFSTAAARAEAELACWLAQPTQMGFPPSQLELVDSQTLYWPGYDEPVECFLFRFAYEAGNSEYANIGIAGPLCHAFEADLADLPPNDIFALFAGWHAEHDEIYEFDARSLSDAQRVDVGRIARKLHDEGYQDVRPAKLGLFFGERVLVAHAVRDGQAGIAVTTRETTQWLLTASHRRPLGPSEAFLLFKGRRLLRAFNP